MSTSTVSRLTRVPGGFDTESEMASESTPGQSPYEDDASEDNLSSLLPERMDASTFLPRTEQDSNIAGNNTLEEQEMHKKLTDFESSSLPELSHIEPAQAHPAGEDETFRFGIPNENLTVKRKPSPIDKSEQFKDEQISLRSPQTPSGAYKRPAPEEQISRMNIEDDDESPDAPHTSSLETMSSSPTAAAAARTVSRV